MSEREESPVGRPLTRVDGPLKVRGRAKYAVEFPLENVCHAVMVRSTVAHGKITHIDKAAAARMPGVLYVLTHENAPQLPKKGRAAVKPPAGREMSLLQEAEVRYNGEPVAVVVAETIEQARAAADAVHVTYAKEPATLRFSDAKRNPAKPDKANRSPTDKDWGDPKAGRAGAEVKVEATYSTPMEHHNPIEPHGTIAQWKGEKLTLYDATQYVSGAKETVAKTLGISEEDVRVICPFVGGGFGCKGSVWSHVVLAAMVAKPVGRPVKLVLERPQMFGPVGGRPQTEQHVVLGAKRDGTLVLIEHNVISHTSKFEEFTEASAQPTRALYACANGTTTHRLAKLDVGTPTFQRAPGESTGTFAIESAMDELAYALAMDPLQLRLKNYAELEPSSGKPWSSKKLRECYVQAAQRFGWDRRNPKVRSMREGRWQVGYGVATATYPAHREKAEASAQLMPEGIFLVRSGTQDLGTGTYTIMTQIAAESLGVPVEMIHFELGDSQMPKAPVSGGSMTAGSVGPAVQAACDALREKLEIMDASLKSARDAADRRERYRALASRSSEKLEAKGEVAPPATEEEKKTHAERSFGAVFAEVRVDQDLGIIRVPRVVATYSIGRLLNAKTGLSQLQGGIVWGVGMALLEESVLDERVGRIVNGNLAEYHVPINADIGILDVTVVEENDTEFNSIGARGIGEIGITGVPAALANAVYHATGKRVRELPITLDKLI